jgi:hypothetical protein
MVALEIWCRYYSRYFEDLFVLCCGTKPEYDSKLDEFKEKYNLTSEKLEGDDYAPGDAKVIICGKQQEFLKDHKWTLFSNCDELVATDPTKYKDLKDFMERTTSNWQWCIGYEVLKEDDEDWLDYSQPILKQRRSWLKNPSMNKVLIGRVPLLWNDGQHQIPETTGKNTLIMKNRGLYLIHLKHADFNAPGRDYVQSMRPMFAYVLENFKWKEPIPEFIRELI